VEGVRVDALTPACRGEFRRINLHWHDLRHEYASRLVEHGVPLSQVRNLLGHASIVTTERYDNQQLERLQVAAGKLESGKLFEAPTGESGTEFHIPCTIGPTIEAAGSPARSDDVDNPLSSEAVEVWLGGRDSRPFPASEASRDVPESCRAATTEPKVREVGWEAGIRTPITWSRG
jgi:hypothetical protein